MKEGILMKGKIIHGRFKAFTLIEILIVIVVIGILVAAMVYASDEMVVTAKANNVISNLYALKTAMLMWRRDNPEKIVNIPSSNPKRLAGTVLIGNKSQPIQQWGDVDLQISKYIDNGVNIRFNENFNKGNYLQGKNTDLQPGCYGHYDDGKDRRIWYVGYRFTEGEDRVKAKVIRKTATNNLIKFTDQGDPYDTYKIEDDNKNKKEEEKRKNSQSVVWLMII